MPAAYKYEIYKDKSGQFRFRFKAPNGKVMFSGDGYKTKIAVMKSVESIKKNAVDGVVEEVK